MRSDTKTSYFVLPLPDLINNTALRRLGHEQRGGFGLTCDSVCERSLWARGRPDKRKCVIRGSAVDSTIMALGIENLV
jgi:hypothetical protein